MKKKIGIVQYPGSNCIDDTLEYFKDHDVFIVWHKDTTVPKEIDLLILPGGFAYGDRYYEKATDAKYVIEPGKMASEANVSSVIMALHERGVPILGICNGFQILIHLGLLPGKLIRNKSNRFCCKTVVCTLYSQTESINSEIHIANEYGRYIAPERGLSNEQVFLTYTDYENGSSQHNGKDIGGVCNVKHNVFGMMPHPERGNNGHLKKFILNVLNNDVAAEFDYKINRLMNSEHISYKSTRHLLKSLHTQESWVVQGPGENAGIVDLGVDDYCLALRIESHNHPTFIDPYNGAATGVGGIIRDIIAMGAKPIALLDFLRFGTDDNAAILFNEAVRGIAHYGNTIGIPNVGGNTFFHSCYNKNPLVNVACMGLVKKQHIIYGNAKNESSLLMYIGSKTGKEGVDGAYMASASFKGSVDHLKDNVQIGDPFLERLLLEACNEMAELGIIEGMQDMGAGGILCASLELIKRGREKTKKNLGCVIHLDKIPVKYEMDLCDKLISESQERMLLVCTEKNKEKIMSILRKWDLESEIIGSVTQSGNYEVKNHNSILYEKSVLSFCDPKETWKLKQHFFNRKEPLQKPTTPDHVLWSIYDNSIGRRVEKGPLDKGHFSVLDLKEINKKLVITWGDHFLECHNTMVKRFEKCKPLAIVNCLNYGHPKEHMYEIEQFINQLTYYGKLYQVPVVGGNVSLYNSTDGVSINPSPILVMVGIM